MDVRIDDRFDLQKIADSGQCFRVRVFPDGTYRFLTGEQVLYIRSLSGRDYRVNCSPEIWESVWRPYFDLDRDYQAVDRAIPAGDAFLKEAARYGAGIRILRQDPWETLVTFILSQRKSIPAIRSVVETLCERYGTELRTPRETLRTFPPPDRLRDAEEADYRACRAGYRAPYLCGAVRQVLSGELDLRGIGGLPDRELIAALEGVRGVGVKVASCVALFAYGRTGCAPVDTWIRKVIRKEYGGRDPFAGYGDAAGIMQQYLFYYAQHRGGAGL